MDMETLQAPELLGCLLLALATLLLLFKQQLLAPYKRRTTSRSLPSPRGLPLIGNLHQLGALPHAALAAMADKHAAPLMLLRLGSVPTLVVSTADAARAVFQPNDRALSGRPALCAAARLSYGRQDISFAPRVHGEATALVTAVENASRSGSPVNLSDRLVEASSKIVRRVAFGDEGEEATIGRTKAVLEEAQGLLGSSTPTSTSLRFPRMRRMRKRTWLMCSSACTAIRLTGTRSAVAESKAFLMDMFIAGTDTSAATLEWTMTELVRHPDILAKAQHEVRSAVPGRDMVLESDLPGLHYLKLVIRESLRLHPPAPLLVPRETTEPITVSGCEIPAGTRVLVNAKAIGVDTDAWGPDAARFVPERHERDGVDLGDHKPWHDSFALVPFGFGRRSCPGVHFATAVVELLLANLLLCFDWRAPPGGEVDVEEENGLTVYRKNPLVLIAQSRTR
ncbi:hypothetical protein ACP4OV_011237 [Aristida adscensionis]